MLMHHDARDYKHAAKKAATWAEQKFNEIVKQGHAKLSSVAEQVSCNVPTDSVVRAPALQFAESDGSIITAFDEAYEEPHGLHKHALNQVAERTGLPSPKRTVDFLLEQKEWGAEYLADMFNRLYEDQRDKKYLVRAVRGEVRGFLTDSYRRLDSGPIIEAFLGTIAKYNAVPVTARATDTKYYLKFVLPQIFEPIENELMLFGLQIQNSDYGDGALSLKAFVHRLRCTNLMLTEDGFRKVHLGKRLDDNITYSQQTYELDTKATCSAVKDVVGGMLGPDNINERFERIQEVAETEVNVDAVLKGLRAKSRLTNGEADKVGEIYRSADVERLPPGNTAWRLSNAISLYAQSMDTDRELELEQLAGSVAKIQK